MVARLHALKCNPIFHYRYSLPESEVLSPVFRNSWTLSYVTSSQLLHTHNGNHYTTGSFPDYSWYQCGMCMGKLTHTAVSSHDTENLLIWQSQQLLPHVCEITKKDCIIYDRSLLLPYLVHSVPSTSTTPNWCLPVWSSVHRCSQGYRQACGVALYTEDDD